MNYEDFRKANKKVSGFLSNEKYLGQNFPNLFQKIDEFNLETHTLTFKEKIYRYFKNDTGDKECVCGGRRKFLSIEKGYQEFCSASCSNKNTVGRIKKSKEKKYGDPNYNNSEKLKESVSKRTDEERQKILDKRRKTKGEKYGDPNYTNPGKSGETRKKTNQKNRNELIQVYDVEILECLEDRSYKIRCKKCREESNVLNSRFNVRLRRGQDPCIKCNNIATGVSSQEEEIAQYIESLGIEVIRGDRKELEGYEMDVFVPSLRIGFEYNGLFWHSEFRIEKDYHISKQEKAASKGISLIHIWEDDWEKKKEIVKSRISHLLGKTEKRLFTRKCSVKEVKYREAMVFLNENHIQGVCPFQKSIGLYYGEDLVSISTFGKRKISGSTGNELLRFCNKKGYSIPGGFSRMLSHYIKTESPEEIITFADRAWTTSLDNFYVANGFVPAGTTIPNYWYIIGKERKHRFSFRKSELIKGGFDPNKTEREIMRERGILRIYDCGQYKYVWKNI